MSLCVISSYNSSLEQWEVGEQAYVMYIYVSERDCHLLFSRFCAIVFLSISSWMGCVYTCICMCE